MTCIGSGECPSDLKNRKLRISELKALREESNLLGEEIACAKQKLQTEAEATAKICVFSIDLHFSRPGPNARSGGARKHFPGAAC